MSIQFDDSGIIYIYTSIQQPFKLKRVKSYEFQQIVVKKIMKCKYRREFTFQVGTDKMFINNLGTAYTA